jgi:hypothetical protein
MSASRFAFVLAVVLHLSTASAEIVKFDGVATSSLPYTEAGLAFTNVPGNTPAIVAGGADGYLTAGTNFVPIHIHVAGDQPFNLASLDIEELFRNWRIESSTGAIVHPSGTGTLDFSSLPGWSNLTAFDIVHDPAESNGAIRVDNIVFSRVPEPSVATVLLALSSFGLLLRRRRRLRRICGPLSR